MVPPMLVVLGLVRVGASFGRGRGLDGAVLSATTQVKFIRVRVRDEAQIESLQLTAARGYG